MPATPHHRLSEPGLPRRRVCQVSLQTQRTMHRATAPLPLPLATIHAKEITAVLFVRVAPILHQVCVPFLLAHGFPLLLRDTRISHSSVKCRFLLPAQPLLEVFRAAGQDLVALVAVPESILGNPAVREADEE